MVTPTGKHTMCCSTRLAERQPVAKRGSGSVAEKTSNRFCFVVRGNLNSVVQSHHAGNALATMDAKLPLVERIHPTANGNNALPRFDFDPPQPWKVLLREEVHHTAFQISVGLVQHQLTSDHRCTTWGLRFIRSLPGAVLEMQFMCRLCRRRAGRSLRPIDWHTIRCA